MDIGRSDLGLLVVFEALMQELSVTRAGARLGLSQPATSAALSRLRRLAGDPLFTRTGRGLAPTARALDLIGPVGDALARLRGSLRPPERFDPASTARRFTLMLSDIGEIIYPPRLFARIWRNAPGVQVLIRRLSSATLSEELERGTVDAAIGFVPRVPDTIRQEHLFEEEYVCAVRRDHPRIRSTLTLDGYLSEAHLLVAKRAGGDVAGFRPIDGEVASCLARMGRERRAAMTMPHFLPAAMVVGETDLCLTLPRKLGELCRGPAKLALLPLPFAVPVFPVSLFWHRRFQDDGGIGWLRDTIVDMFRARHPGRGRAGGPEEETPVDGAEWGHSASTISSPVGGSSLPVARSRRPITRSS